MQNTTLPSIDNFKLHAKLIKAILGKHIKLGQALTLLSQQYGYKNWQSFRPVLLNSTPEQKADTELMEYTTKALDKWFEKFPDTEEEGNTMEQFANSHPDLWRAFLEAKGIEDATQGEDGVSRAIESNTEKIILQTDNIASAGDGMSYRYEDILTKHFAENDGSNSDNPIEYALEGRYDDMPTRAEGQEITIAYDLIHEHLQKESPTPLLIIVSSSRTKGILKDLYYENIQEFKQLSREMLFSQGRSKELKVFDIITKKESYEMPERILVNCKVVEVPHLIRNARVQRPGSKTVKVTQHLKDIPKETLNKVLNMMKSESKKE
jgi:hypothetical protein